MGLNLNFEFESIPSNASSGHNASLAAKCQETLVSPISVLNLTYDKRSVLTDLMLICKVTFELLL